jgi:plasmid maintenance system antidote protein VapI
MKSYKEVEKKYTPEEIAESIIFPGTKDKKERDAILSAFRDYRKKISKRQTEESKVISLLLQLKFLIEDYLDTSAFNKDYYFGYFLKEYITRLEKKNKEFAKEIDVNPTELSQIINKHRKPTEKLIFRLEIHSNKNFPALMWFKVLEKDRAYELLHNKEIIENEKKHVKQKLEFSLLK